MSSSFLRLQSVTVFVRDQDQSLRFYVDKLGFKLIADSHLPNGTRWVGVAPSEGVAMLTLVTPPPDLDQSRSIGRNTEVVFLAEDAPAKFDEWLKKGVRFREVPVVPNWAGTFGVFEDLDGNSFALVGYDEATKRIEAERLAEAARLEAERSAAQEFTIAKQVQARLFPQSKPDIPTLDYTGVCLQARQVGGDYYDFLPLGPGRLGLVVGDIAGKGIAGALLMANLQANLRSQCANALDDPISRLPLVNQLFYDNTADSSYATLFFAEYDSQSQRLRYANCGHLPGLLLRRDGSLLRLKSTSTVLGLFENWTCATEQVAFLSGDLLLLFTDGLSEATNQAGEEFGEERLIECLTCNQQAAPDALVAAIIGEVQRFSPFEQQDDITLIAARVRS